MKEKFVNARTLVAQGWTMMFLIFLAMFVADLTKSAVFQDFSKWSEDPGYGGLMILLGIMSIYAFMPMLVLSISAKWFRGTVVGITVFFTLFFIAHQLTHLTAGDKPFGMIHILDFTHHILGIWVTIAAVLWVKQYNKEIHS